MLYTFYGALRSLRVFTEVKHLRSRWCDRELQPAHLQRPHAIWGWGWGWGVNQQPISPVDITESFWNSVQHIPAVNRAAFLSSACRRKRRLAALFRVSRLKAAVLTVLRKSVWPHLVIFFLVSVHAHFFLLENLCFQSPRPVARRQG